MYIKNDYKVDKW